MNTQHMHALITVAHCGSINKASLELGISAPSLKHELDGIEQETGVRVFERSFSGMSLTPSGEVLVDAFQRALDTIDEGVRNARLTAQRGGLAVRVIYVPFHFSEPAGLYSQAIAQYHKEHPDVSVSLKQVKRHGVAGPADVLLGAVDPVATETVGRFLMYIPLYVCVGLDHPLVWRKTVQLADLDLYRLLVPNRETFLHVTAGVLPYLDGRGHDVDWSTAPQLDTAHITIQCLTTYSAAIVIGPNPPIMQTLAAIPLEGYSFAYELYTRKDADPTVLEYAEFISEFYHKATAAPTL